MWQPHPNISECLLIRAPQSQAASSNALPVGADVSAATLVVGIPRVWLHMTAERQSLAHVGSERGERSGRSLAACATAAPTVSVLIGVRCFSRRQQQYMWQLDWLEKGACVAVGTRISPKISLCYHP